MKTKWKTDQGLQHVLEQKKHVWECEAYSIKTTKQSSKECIGCGLINGHRYPCVD